LGFVDDFKKIDSTSASGAAIFFFSMLAPGFLAIFVFEKQLFIELETIKLMLLALSLSSPGVIIPIFTSSISVTVIKKMHGVDASLLGSVKDWFYRAAINNAINMYIILFLSYVFSWRFSVFLWLFLLSILVVCVFEMVYMIKRAKDPDKYPLMDLP